MSPQSAIGNRKSAILRMLRFAALLCLLGVVGPAGLVILAWWLSGKLTRENIYWARCTWNDAIGAGFHA